MIRVKKEEVKVAGTHLGEDSTQHLTQLPEGNFPSTFFWKVEEGVEGKADNARSDADAGNTES